jgi:hypothetical protein
VKYQIKCNTSKVFEINSNEELYFNQLFSKLTADENKRIVLHRMSNGSIEPYYKGYPIGKIKLQGKKHSMQILKSLYKFDVIEGTVSDFIKRIDDVILYIRKYCK